LSPPAIRGIIRASCPPTTTPFVIKAPITIADIEPPIWRRLLLPRELNFAQFHKVIQAAFGWTDSHLHQFVVGGLVGGAPEFVARARTTLRLGKYAAGEKRYEKRTLSAEPALDTCSLPHRRLSSGF
jgi:hypothetical protein